MQLESKKIDSIIKYWILLEELKRQKEKLHTHAQKFDRQSSNNNVLKLRMPSV